MYKRQDLDTGVPGRLQHAGALGHRDRNVVDLQIDHFLVHVLLPSLMLGNGVEAAVVHTGAALDALFLVDDMGSPDHARDGVGGAVLGAQGAEQNCI